MNIFKANEVYRTNKEARHLYYWGLFAGFLLGVSFTLFLTLFI